MNRKGILVRATYDDVRNQISDKYNKPLVLYQRRKAFTYTVAIFIRVKCKTVASLELDTFRSEYTRAHSYVYSKYRTSMPLLLNELWANQHAIYKTVQSYEFDAFIDR